MLLLLLGKNGLVAELETLYTRVMNCRVPAMYYTLTSYCISRRAVSRARKPQVARAGYLGTGTGRAMHTSRVHRPDQACSRPAAWLLLGMLLALCAEGRAGASVSASKAEGRAGAPEPASKAGGRAGAPEPASKRPQETVLDLAAGRGPLGVDLGKAGGYVILSSTGVSTTGITSITGNVGVSPAAQTYLTGFDLIQAGQGSYAQSTLVTGRLTAADNTGTTPSRLSTAVLNMQAAYTDASSRSANRIDNYKTGSLGGSTLTPGLYWFEGTVGVRDDCTLTGTASDTWIFIVSGKLSVSAGKSIKLAGGAQARNVVWAVAEQATFEVGSHFEGILLGKTAAVFKTGASHHGRVLVQTAATLDATTITQPASRLELPVRPRP